MSVKYSSQLFVASLNFALAFVFLMTAPAAWWIAVTIVLISLIIVASLLAWGLWLKSHAKTGLNICIGLTGTALLWTATMTGMYGTDTQSAPLKTAIDFGTYCGLGLLFLSALLPVRDRTGT